MYDLILIDGKRVLASHSLRGQKVTFGWNPENTISIRDVTVSGLHAEFVCEDGKYWVRDLNSTNGVLFEGKAVRELLLPESGVLRMGNIVCLFRPPGLSKEEHEAGIERLKEANGRVVELERQLSDVSARRDQALSEAAESRKALDLAVAAADKLRGELADRQEQLRVISAGRDELRSSSERAEEALRNALFQVDTLKATHALLQGKADEAARVAVELTGLKQRVSELLATIEAKEACIRDANARVAEFERNESNLRRMASGACETLEASVAELRSQAAALLAELEGVRTEHRGSIEKSASIELEKEQLAKALRQKDGECLRLNAELQAERNRRSGAAANERL